MQAYTVKVTVGVDNPAKAIAIVIEAMKAYCETHPDVDAKVNYGFGDLAADLGMMDGRRTTLEGADAKTG